MTTSTQLFSSFSDLLYSEYIFWKWRQLLFQFSRVTALLLFSLITLKGIIRWHNTIFVKICIVCSRGWVLSTWIVGKRWCRNLRGSLCSLNLNHLMTTASFQAMQQTREHCFLIQRSQALLIFMIIHIILQWYVYSFWILTLMVYLVERGRS